MTFETTEATHATEDAAAAGRGEPGLLSAIWQAVRGVRTSYDYTEGPVGRSIMLLAVPMVLEMLMESVFVMADVFFVSRLGPQAVATVGLTESLLTIVYTLAVGLGIGATATVARRIGEKDPEGAAHVAAQVLALGVLVSLVLGAAGFAFAPQLLGLMGASPEVVASGSGYTRVMLGGCASVVMLFLVNAVFRGAGDAAIAMRSLWLANAINIVLAPCLIFGPGPFPEMGVVGAAVGTTIGRGVGALYAISRLFRAGSRLRLTLAQLGLDPSVMRKLARLSSSAMFQVFIGMASWIGLVRILSGFGDQALAGYVIGIRVILFALFPSWGLGNAAATMVGQALGAGKPERAERAVWLAGFYNTCFLGAVGLVFVLFAGTIVGFFTSDPAVLAYGSDCLRIVAAGFLFYAYGMVLTQSFNGAGDTRTPTVINLFVFWLWELPLAYALAHWMGFGPRGVFIAITVAFSTLAIVSALVFRRGRWKTREV
ncbi:MAG TPA: MATE family efflux transporter [Pyrinomonadaceae bacterium]|nr:MATE family efflux transporter [Pyrinomonadaceae bacterium]